MELLQREMFLLLIYDVKAVRLGKQQKRSHVGFNDEIWRRRKEYELKSINVSNLWQKAKRCSGLECGGYV